MCKYNNDNDNEALLEAATQGTSHCLHVQVVVVVVVGGSK